MLPAGRCKWFGYEGMESPTRAIPGSAFLENRLGERDSRKNQRRYVPQATSQEAKMYIGIGAIVLILIILILIGVLR